MYFWKCWRDTRLRFFFYLSLYVGITALWIVLAAHLAQVGSAPRSQLWPMMIIGGAFLYGFPLAMLTGLGLGSIGVGAEVGTGSGEFLLTRPRPRRYFLWVGWAVGMVEVLVVLAVVGLIVMTVLRYKLGPAWQHTGPGIYRTGEPRPESFDVLCTLLLSLMVTGAWSYGLAYFMSVVTRSGQRAINYSMAIILGYWMGSVLVTYWTHAHLPSVTGMPLYDFGAGAYGVDVTRIPRFPLIGRALLAVGFPFAAQFVLDRAEV